VERGNEGREKRKRKRKERNGWRKTEVDWGGKEEGREDGYPNFETVPECLNS